MEENRQKAIRCTEEVVRREETCKKEHELEVVRGEWRKERQQLFQEAHQSQLRAIARQNALLEQKLRKEFAETMVKVQGQHREHIEQVKRDTWAEADIVKEKAIKDTRIEEKDLAQQEAKMVAERVAGEKRREAELAAAEKARALNEQREYLGQLQDEALTKQERQLEDKFDAKLNEVSENFETKLSELQSRLDQQVTVNQSLERDLDETTSLKNEWKGKYEALKKEFSNFIDQFPGFRGEFVLD